MHEDTVRDRMVSLARSLFERGHTHGSTGNLSVRLPAGRWLVTPTGASFGNLDPERISLLDEVGTLLAGDPPSKEAGLHQAVYRERPRAGAVVHLHSVHSVAVSVLEGIDPTNVLPPLTAYYVMRIGSLPLVDYYPPGDPDLARAVAAVACRHHALLLAHHGPVVAGRTLEAACDAVEELEATARLRLLLGNQPCRCLKDDEVKRLRQRFPIDA